MLTNRLLLLATLAGLPLASQASSDCSVALEGSDAMRFSTNLISVPASCHQVTITLTHPGTLPAKVMGHNIVITDRENLQAVANDGLKAGFDNHYIKPGDERVYGASKVIGGGESTTMTFNTGKMKAGGDYVFLCSFPGHWAMMQGTFEFK
ncbi:azurin [Endozoicomonas sp. OPT23]|uniref:azurin n=1 Tax=Endozoicomonas sp. OPT23 TaxID=2072845 RepID=UPI00129AA594|nr:azurin [Endozoicomonas sp. OPT23]MRI33826.1 azurin [Endozoicomonas sp. OPT23]